MKNKYNAKKTELNGVMYDSMAEAAFAAQLEMQRMSIGPDKIVSIERQPKFPLNVNQKLVCTYIGDFRVRYADGRVIVYDVKGVRTDVYIIKKKLVQAVYGIEIIEVGKSKSKNHGTKKTGQRIKNNKVHLFKGRGGTILQRTGTGLSYKARD